MFTVQFVTELDFLFFFYIISIVVRTMTSSNMYQITKVDDLRNIGHDKKNYIKKVNTVNRKKKGTTYDKSMILSTFLEK